jgi:hypothetical protein
VGGKWGFYDSYTLNQSSDMMKINCLFKILNNAKFLHNCAKRQEQERASESETSRIETVQKMSDQMFRACGGGGANWRFFLFLFLCFLFQQFDFLEKRQKCGGRRTVNCDRVEKFHSPLPKIILFSPLSAFLLFLLFNHCHHLLLLLP